MLTYSKYKDSGVDWIGEIPEGWTTTAIRHVLQLHSGSALPDDQYDAEGDFPVYGGGAIRGRAKQCNVQGQTVIVSRQGATCGTTRFIEGNAWITEHALIAYFLDVMYNKRYFAYVLHAMNLGNLSMTAAQPGISASIVQSQHTPVPNHIEQQAIADYLDEKTAAIDAAVADIERSIELLNEYRQSVISEAVTKGLNPNAPMKDSGINWIGDIPLQWTVTKIINLATRKSGHTPDKKKEEYWQNGDIVWISLADSPALRKQHYVSESNTMTNMEGINHSSAELLPPGTVLLSRDASIGLTAIAATELAVSQHFMAYICGPKLYNEYLYYTFESMQQELNRLSMGSTIPTIGLPLIHGLRIPVPPIEEQHEIVDCLQHKLNELDSLIAQKQALVVRLKEYRSSLISECVTGKVKVPGVEEA